MSAQTQLFNVLGTPNLNSAEQANLTKIQEVFCVDGQQVVTLNPLETVLNGRLLDFAWPGESGSKVFQADIAVSDQPGSYHWMGYHPDGSWLNISKQQDDVLGGAYNATTQKRYQLISLSNSKAAWVRCDSVAEPPEVCGTTGEADPDEGGGSDRSGCPLNAIRVLFLYTPAISGVVAPSAGSVAQFLIREINDICAASGLPPTEIRFESAGITLLNGFLEAVGIREDLIALRDNALAKTLRNQYHADIVVLLTATHTMDGAVRAVGVAGQTVSNNNGYAAVELPAAITGLSVTHEIGHLIGARHQRCSVCNVTGCTNTTSNHGFLVGGTRGTVMAQLTCPANVGRLARWSNPDMAFGGLATGDAANNNAAILRARAGTVSCFRDSPPLTGGGGDAFLVSIQGPSEVCNRPGYYPFTSTITTSPYAAPPFTYAPLAWEIGRRSAQAAPTCSPTRQVCPITGRPSV